MPLTFAAYLTLTLPALYTCYTYTTAFSAAPTLTTYTLYSCSFTLHPFHLFLNIYFSTIHLFAFFPALYTFMLYNFTLTPLTLTLYIHLQLLFVSTPVLHTYILYTHTLYLNPFHPLFTLSPFKPVRTLNTPIPGSTRSADVDVEG